MLEEMLFFLRKLLLLFPQMILTKRNTKKLSKTRLDLFFSATLRHTTSLMLFLAYSVLLDPLNLWNPTILLLLYPLSAYTNIWSNKAESCQLNHNRYMKRHVVIHLQYRILLYVTFINREDTVTVLWAVVTLLHIDKPEGVYLLKISNWKWIEQWRHTKWKTRLDWLNHSFMLWVLLASLSSSRSQDR